MSVKPAYRPEIDGLRALAVTGVILYHFGATWLPGGFTGVDVFFVISGFLITSIISREMDAGRFTLAGFYARRVRRIVPVLSLVLVVSVAAGWWLLVPDDYANLGKSALHAIFGFGNVFFYRHTGYFDQAAALQPLLHTWSLGVEEQFYLAWPLALIAITKVFGRKSLPIILLIFTFSGFGLSIYETHRNPGAAFYLPHSRGWELSLGALIAFAPQLQSRNASNIATMLGLSLVGMAYFVIDEAADFPGAWALLPCIGAALLVWPKQGCLIDTALARAAPVGLISYGLYLWHWPILVYYSHYAGRQPDLMQSWVLVALSVSLAYLSWRYIEKPFRAPSRVRPTTLFGCAVAAFVVLLSAPLVISGGVPSRATDEALKMAGVDTMWEWSCPQIVELDGVSYCGFGVDWKNASERAILWGDSHAEHLAPVLDAISTQTSFILAGPCVPIAGRDVVVDIGIPSYIKTCSAAREAAMTILQNHSEIGTIILSAAWASRIPRLRDSTGVAGEGEALLQRGLDDLLSSSIVRLRRTILIADTPILASGTNPSCTASSTYLAREVCPPIALTRTQFDEFEMAAAENALASAGARHGVEAVFPSTTMCPDACITSFGGLPIYRDQTHFRRNLSEEQLLALGRIIGLDALGL